MPELSVVLPCYNEAGNLKNILDRYRPLTAQVSLELVLVDNGSSDGTDEILHTELARQENRFARQVKVDTNIGYGYGLQAGLRECQAGTVAFSHADLQCPPEDLVKAYRLFKQDEFNGLCLVKGRRRGRRAAADRLVTWFYNHLARWLLGIEAVVLSPKSAPDHFARAADINAEPKLFPRSLLDTILKGPQDFTFDLFVLHAARSAGLKIFEFEVSYESRVWGRSKLAANPWMRFVTALRAFRQLLRLAVQR